MRKYSTRQLAEALASVGVGRGDLLCMHSSLPALGRLDGVAPEEVAETVIGVLLDRIGPEGTLVVPAFNFGFCKGEAFDRQSTPSVGVGLLSEYVRRMPGSLRSPHPMHSLAAVGKLAITICSADTSGPFDPGGAFDTLLTQDATLLLLGANAQAATILHLAEQRVGVPYRYRKEFSGAVTDAGQTRRRTYALYARDLSLDPRLDFRPVEEHLREQRLLKEARLGGGMVRAGRCRDWVDAAQAMLTRDPWSFVASPRPPL